MELLQAIMVVLCVMVMVAAIFVTVQNMKAIKPIKEARKEQERK